MKPGEVATLLVPHAKYAAKRAVVIKEDDLLTKKELLHHSAAVAEATSKELTIWMENDCFEMCDYAKAENIMTSRYVAKWKFVKNPKTGNMDRTIRMRLVLRGFMDGSVHS